MRSHRIAYLGFSVLIGVFLVAMIFGPPSSADASKGRLQTFVDLDCSDFGTRERAQHEFNQAPYDQYGLDSDRDGQACEWNAKSPVPQSWLVSAFGASVGYYFAQIQRKGPECRAAGLKGLFYESFFDSPGKKVEKFDSSFFWATVLVWPLAWLVTITLRDDVLSRSTQPGVLVGISGLVTAGLVFAYTLYIERGSKWLREDRT